MCLRLGLVLLCSVFVACGSGDKDSKPDATATMDSGGGADASPSDAASAIAFLQPCDLAEDQCAEGLVCFGFNRKGPHCTHACTDAAECEAPSPDCNGMGMCKLPD